MQYREVTHSIVGGSATSDLILANGHCVQDTLENSAYGLTPMGFACHLDDTKRILQSIYFF